ncbi:MAG: PfkB family carbohydrate kinase [Chloroflexota bacterium]
MTVDYVTFSNLIIDDIVFPDGRTAMNTLGGAGMHALVGMRLWNGRLGYAATIGHDLDPIHKQTLQQFGVDCLGLVVRDGYANARAWQVFEANDLRIEVFRTELEDFLHNMIREEDLPPAYRQAKGIHLIWGSLAELADLVHSLRRTNPNIVLVFELTPQQEHEPPENLKLVLPHVSLFSPNLDEATAVTGLTDPAAMADLFLSWGAPLVAIRMGAEGSLVKTEDGEQWQLRAIPPTNLKDVTGAGNSYLGGFLTGLGDGLSPFNASLRAAVSASFALEQVGLPSWRTPPMAEVEHRLAWARDNVVTVN